MAGLVSLLAETSVISVDTRFIWPFVAIGLEIRLFLEWRYAGRSESAGTFCARELRPLFLARFLSEMPHAQQGLRECFPCGLCNPDYGAAFIDRLRRVIAPNRSLRIDCNEIPHNAPPIVPSHGTRNQAPFVPELCRACIVNPPQCRR